MKRKISRERFFELMEHTDDDLLVRAEKYSADAANLRMHRIIRVAAVAASLCIVIAACIAVPLAMRKNKLPIDDPVISDTTDAEIAESQNNENETEENAENTAEETVGETAETTGETEDPGLEPGGENKETYSAVYREEDYPDRPATEGLVYRLSFDKKSYYVIGYEGTDTDVYIPATHEGLPVTQIYTWTEGECDVSIHGGFIGSTNISSVFVGKNMENIDSDAFEGCTNLKKVVIPDSVRYIGALGGCPSLSEIIISDKVEEINQYAFLHTAYYKDQSNWENGVLYVGNHVQTAKGASGSVVLRDGTKTVAMYAFSNNDNVTEVIFPESFERISMQAFHRSDALESVSFSGTVKHIDNYAFADCTSLKDINVLGTVERLGYGVFNNTAYYNDPNNWEDGLLYIGNYLLSANYDAKMHTVIKEGTRSISRGAFGSSSALSIVLPSSLETLEVEALRGQRVLEIYNLSKFDVEDMLEKYDADIKIKQVYASLDIPTKFVQHGDYMTYCDAESGLYLLVNYTGDDTELVLPSNIGGHDYEILDSAFAYSSYLTKVTVPKGVAVIGTQAFYKCENLTDVIIDAACIIKDEAFAISEKLINITLSDDIKYIEMFAFDGTAFYNNYHNDSSHYENRFLYVGNHLITDIGSYAEAIYEVREGTKTISAPMSFYFSTTPTQIVLPEGLVGISANVFSQNDNLKQLIIPDSVEYIGRSAFSSSTIENIRIPDKVRVIEERLFSGCKKLEYVIIGSGVEQIKKSAFIANDALKAVYYNGTEEMWNNIDIDDEGNAYLVDATVYFYSENTPVTEGNFWHYVDGVPTAW